MVQAFTKQGKTLKPEPQRKVGNADAAIAGAKRLHDLRGTAITAFMRHGLTDSEIAEILGWKTADVQAIRKRYISRAAIVSAAIARLEKNGG